MAIIPLISSGTEGPLGVKHLPRLWLKTLLKAAGELPEGYKDIRPGFDFMVLEGLKIDPDAARDFILERRPAYLEFEQWIREQEGVDVSAANLEALNQQIVDRQKSDSSRRTMLAENGLPDDSGISDSIMLNNLDDWRAIHGQVTGS